MEQAPLDMLVDHYPIRSVVHSFESSSPESLQSVRLLAEAMTGSEVLIAVADTDDGSFSPLTFNIEGKQYFVAGTSPEYAQSEFVNYLADCVVKANIGLRAMNVRELIALAIKLGYIHAILFDMESNEAQEPLVDSLMHSSLLIDGLCRKAITSPSKLLNKSNEDKFSTIPELVLSMLAREESEAERQSILFDYLSRCSEDELRHTVIFMGLDADGSDTSFTTLARGFVSRVRWHATRESEPGEEKTFTIINLLTWLTSLLEQPQGYFVLDGITVDNDFARRVISAVDSQ